MRKNEKLNVSAKTVECDSVFCFKENQWVHGSSFSNLSLVDASRIMHSKFC